MKKLTPFLMLILCAALLLASCSGGNADTSSEPPASDEVTEPVVENITFIADGATEYKLIRSSNASDTVTDAFIKLRGAINDTYGVQITLGDDFEKPGADPSARHPYEIVIGDTNRGESAEAVEGISYSDTVIAVIGNRLVISGGNDDATARAVDIFIEKYMTGDSLSLPSNLHDVEKAEYAKGSITLGGVPLSDYTMVYGSSYSDYAEEVADRLGKLTGVRFNMQSDKNDPADREIIIGSTSRTGFAKDYGVDDFSIAVMDNDIHVNAANKTALGMACAELAEMLSDERTSYELKDLELMYTLPASRDYVNDIESFPLHWAIEFVTPEWMLDYDEKYAASMDPAGRLMSCAHRGDMVYYPENSIEGIISAIMMGCDMVEIDPRLTKDGVFILLHDATLTRTTNFEEMAGKNGLPTSANVSDWTYEQLMQLSLKMGTGGSGAALTPYKIPTLEEAFKVCANRIFIRLDVKGPTDGVPFWDFEKDIWPLMEKYNSYSNIIYTWHSWFKANSYKLTRDYRAKALALSGKEGIVFIGDAGTLATNKKTMTNYGFNLGIRLSCDFSGYSYKTYLADNKTKLDAYKSKLRTYADVHGTNSKYPENKESHEYYAALFDGGINYMLVNKALLLCTYIAENFEATPVN